MVPTRMFPDEGAKDEFKRAVLAAIWIDMCVECLNEFYTLVPPVRNSWARCQVCSAKKRDAVFAEERYSSFNDYARSRTEPPPNNPP